MRDIGQLEKSIHGFLRDHAVTWIIACIGLTISIIAFKVVNEQIDEQREVEFNWVSQNRNHLVKRELEGALEPLKVVRDYIQTAETTDKELYHQFTTALLSRNHGLDAIGLILKSPIHPNSANRASVSTLMDSNFSLSHIEFRESRVAISRESVTSQPVLLDALKKAQETGEMTVSRSFKLASNNLRKYVVIACLPYYRDGSDIVKTPNLTGFVIAVLRLDELAHAAISYLEPRGVDLLIQDDSAGKDDRFLEFYASRLNSGVVFQETEINDWLTNANTSVTEVVQMGDRRWTITAVPNQSFRSAEAFEEGPFVVLFAGILLTLLLSTYLFRMKLGMQERIRMDQLLKDREELFWQMTETVDDVFWALSMDKKKFLYVSPAIERLWGLKCQQLYDDPKEFSNAIHHKDRDQWLNALEYASQGLGPVETIFRVIRPDGTQRWIRDNTFPVHNEKGRVFRLVGVAEDITEKKLADDALRDSENKLRTIFNQSPDKIMTVDGEGKVLLMNQDAALEHSGRRGEEIHSADMLPSANREDYRQLLARAFENGEVSYLQYQAEDKPSWWEIRIVPIIEDSNVHACMVIATDITEKLNYQTQAIRNARLASIGVIATGVAHEINNPNNAIQTSAALYSHVWKDAMPVLREYFLEQGDFSLGGLSFAEEGESLGDLITEIMDNSRRIKAIVENLKHLGKKDQGELTEEVDVNTALRAAAGVLKSTIRKYTNHWVMELASDLPAVKGNFPQLEQVFINIMLNALQSLPDSEHGVRVESAIDPEKKSVMIRVIDQGSGISDENHLRVTEPFFTTRLEEGGTGLGLSISTTIIENHHGSIKYKSLATGTLVTLRFPIHYR